MPGKKEATSEKLNISELDPELIKAIITGVIYVGSLTATTLATPAGSVVAAIGIGAQGIASNEAVNLVDRAIDRWHANLFIDQGKINKDIAWAMGEAFKLSIEQIRQEWTTAPRYKYLQRTDKLNADLSLNLLKILETDIPEVLLDSDSSLLDQSAQASYANQNRDNEEVSYFLNDVLDRYAYGHDPELTSLLSRSLFPYLPEKFIQVIESNGDRNTRAWKEINRLMWMSTGETLRDLFTLINDQFARMHEEHKESHKISSDIHGIASNTSEEIKQIKAMIEHISPELSISYTESFNLGSEALFWENLDEAEKRFSYCLKVAQDMEILQAELDPLKALATVNIRRGDYLAAIMIYIDIITRLEPKALLSNVISGASFDDLFFAHTHIKYSAAMLNKIYGEYLEETRVQNGEDAWSTIRFPYGHREEQKRVEEFLQNRPKDTELIKKHLEMREIVKATEPILRSALHDFLPDDQNDLLLVTADEDKRLLTALIDRGIFDTFDYEMEDIDDEDEFRESVHSYEELFKTIEAVFEYAYLAGDREQILDLTFGYGRVLKITKKYDKARIYLDKALTLAEEAKNRRLAAITTCYLGEMDIEEGNKIEGEQRLRDSIREMEYIKIEYPFIEDYIRSMKGLLQSISEE